MKQIIKGEIRLSVNFGDIDPNSVINLPKKVPIFSDFNVNKIIGYTVISREGNKLFSDIKKK